MIYAFVAYKMETKCQAILQSGANKGNKCSNKALNGMYCGRHVPKVAPCPGEEMPERNAVDETLRVVNVDEKVIQGDCIEVMRTLGEKTAQIVICDPPYNIGKDFGNNSDKQEEDDYLVWCDKWIFECLRVLKDNGTCFIYGFSETLALILARIPKHINRRWLVWHYTNKTVPSLNFWQRTHESILVLWKDDKVFNRDAVREPYTDEYLEGCVGKERSATVGRFSNGTKTTTYTAHPNGALPRDVIKNPTLAGGSGSERFKYKATADSEEIVHPTQKPLTLCEKLLLSAKQDEGFVLIPFGGSGSEAVACRNLGMSFVCIELNQQYVDMIGKRLSS